MLSFGEEAEEEEKELADVKIKIKSSHDVLDDPRLLKEESLKNNTVIVITFSYNVVFWFIMICIFGVLFCSIGNSVSFYVPVFLRALAVLHSGVCIFSLT